MVKESKYADHLRALGFVESQCCRAKQVRDAIREAQTVIDSFELPPMFTPNEDVTYATDETGQTWEVPTKIDLTSIGFKNSHQ